MARTPAGLTDEQVGGLRTALQENRRPKVTVAGQQFGGETIGQVVTVGDPASEGQEFIQVRVKLDGLTDILRFAPKELRLPDRRRAIGARATAPATTRTPRRAAAPQSATSEPATPKPAAPNTNGAMAAPPPATAPAVARPQAATPVAPARQPTATAAAAAPVQHPAAAKPVPRTRKAAVRPPTVTITITSSGTDWTVTANRGGKSVLKAAPLAPGVVAAALELLDQPVISTAVDEVNGAALSLAEQRAEELRAELAAVESVLAAHRAPGRRLG